jgi:hypothetical protein
VTSASRRPVTALALGVVVTSAVSGCAGGIGAQTSTSPSPTAPKSPHELDHIVDSFRHDFDCAERFDTHADLAFFGESSGFDCILADRSAVFVKAYAHPETIEHVVVEWAPTFGTGRSWTGGDNWVVSGPRADLERVAAEHRGTTLSTKAPDDAGGPLVDEARNTCMAFVSSAAADYVQDSSRFTEVAEGLDREYPGATTMITATVSEAFRSTHLDSPDYQLAAALSSFGAEFRQVCVDAHRRTREELE